MSLPMNSAMRKAKERRMMNVAISRKITETATRKDDKNADGRA